MRRKPRRGEVWIGGGYRVLITSMGARVGFVRLNSEAKGTIVRCDLDQFLAAYAPEVREGDS